MPYNTSKRVQWAMNTESDLAGYIVYYGTATGVTINEFCLMSQAATGGGTMWTRILTGAIALSSGDSLQTTYDLTIE